MPPLLSWRGQLPPTPPPVPKPMLQQHYTDGAHTCNVKRQEEFRIMGFDRTVKHSSSYAVSGLPAVNFGNIPRKEARVALKACQRPLLTASDPSLS